MENIYIIDKSMKKKDNMRVQITKDELDSYLQTDHKLGLSSEEALKRQQKFGLNALVKQKRENFLLTFIKTILFEPMSLLLFISGMIGLVLAIVETIQSAQTGSQHYILSFVQTAVLLSIVIINAFFGTIQERKSSNAIEELEKISTPTSKVLRDGKIIQIDSKELTIGDILVVEAGDTVNADAKLFFDSHLKISEAILTGESAEVLKDSDAVAADNSPLGDQKNKIFAGTNVLNGKGYGIVYAISNDTEMGKVADLLNDREAVISPLQLKLQKLGKVLGLVGMAITILTFIFSLLVIEGVVTGASPVVKAIQSSLLLAISLAAASIPEGLAAITTIVLSLGVKKMTTRHALVKKLPSVETLGSTAVICSDKTGTLTMNKMTVVKLLTIADLTKEIQGDLINLNEIEKDVLTKASLCTDSVIDENPDLSQRKAAIGDPTEVAILDLTLKNNLSVLNLKNQYPRIREIPFDSERKLMSSINEINGKKILIVKGAPDVIFARCKNFDQNLVSQINNKWSDQAIRVLAIAQKEIQGDLPEDLVPEDYEFDLEFLGLIGMIDPPREEVKVSIQECVNSGIKPIMITGDHLNTAVAIARELGIVKNEHDQAITGLELDQMSDQELVDKIENYAVYARVSPENKIRIVKAWQAKDQVVAMTGDGVNDAPALKAADIGCAMGITGTDVAKQAADMILMDDNFSTIVESVKLGRNIYEGIRRITKFLLSSNLTGIFSIVIGMFIFYIAFQTFGWGAITTKEIEASLGQVTNIKADELAYKLNQDVKFTTTITTIQILINHMIFETFPGIALGSQMSISDFMKRRPRSKYESIFADKLIWQIIVTGILHGILTIAAYTIGVQIAISQGAPLLRFYYGSVAAFIVMTIGGILKSISMCSAEVVWKIKWNESKWIYLTALVSFSLTAIVIFIPKLTAITAEYPNDLNFKDYQNFGITQDDFQKLIHNLSGNKWETDFVDWKIYLISASFGVLTFIGLEVYKLIDLKWFKTKKAKPITEFELIPRPLTWKQKMANRRLKRMET